VVGEPGEDLGEHVPEVVEHGAPLVFQGGALGGRPPGVLELDEQAVPLPVVLEGGRGRHGSGGAVLAELVEGLIPGAGVFARAAGGFVGAME
jgi:hypothetical protein